MLDIKKRGVMPITDLVRVYALANGIVAVNTQERLQQLLEQKVIDENDARNLMDATWRTRPGEQHVDNNIALSSIAPSPPIIAAGCLLPRIADTSQYAPSRWVVKLKVHTRYASALTESKRFIKRFDTRASVYIIPRLRAGIA